MTSANTPVGYQIVSASDSSQPTLQGTIERLEKSRRGLREQMLALNDPNASSGTSAQRPRKPNALMESLKSTPVLGALLDSMASWWSTHPLRVLAGFFAESTSSAARPITRRYPWATLFAALGVGAFLVWARPWRFALLRRAVYAGLLPQIASGVLSRVPTDKWMDLVASFLQRPPAAPSEAQPNRAATSTVSPAATWGHGSAPASSLH